MLRYTVRPISDRTWQRTTRRQSKFTAGWTDTLDLLERELNHLSNANSRDLVIEVDVREQDIRNDGMLNARAIASGPAVVLAFESVHGPMLYRADAYSSGPDYRNAMQPWQHNVRAIALTLESLRAVDRYGATETGQQYTGFKALPSGGIALGAAMSKDEACDVLARHAGWTTPPDWMDPAVVELAYRDAVKVAHPDAGGTSEAFQQVQHARRVLEGVGA